MQADSPAPLIYWAWQRQLAAAVLADDVSPALWQRSLQGRSFTDALVNILAAGDNSWCDDQRTPAPETCAQQADRAYTLALEELQAAYGQVPARWRWGQAHQTRFEHRPFSNVAALAALFELRVPVGGDQHSLNANRVVLRADERSGLRYHSDHGPGLRAVYDLADPARSVVMQSTGQSGIVFSPLYRSLAEAWRRGEYLPLWGEADGERQRLVLEPLPVRP
jgi:penicillin amidase